MKAPLGREQELKDSISRNNSSRSSTVTGAGETSVSGGSSRDTASFDPDNGADHSHEHESNSNSHQADQQQTINQDQSDSDTTTQSRSGNSKEQEL